MFNKMFPTKASQELPRLIDMLRSEAPIPPESRDSKTSRSLGYANSAKGDHSALNDKYCWSCGIKCRHTSADCDWKKKGHRNAATEADKMGGCTCTHQETIELARAARLKK